MQFTVLIEFLIPGLATTLLGLALLPDTAIPYGMPAGLPSGETAAGLLLLMVSYPVGILTNFAVFMPLQQHLLTPLVHRRILAQYAAQGVDLWSAVTMTLHGKVLAGPKSEDRVALRRLFGLMRVAIFCRNIERLNMNHLYHEGLQRLARGMLLPLVLAWFWFMRNPTTALAPSILLVILFLFSLWLLEHSVSTEEEQVASFFLLLVAQPESLEPARPSGIA